MISKLRQENSLTEFFKNYSWGLHYFIVNCDGESKACGNECTGDMKFEVSAKVKGKLSNMSNALKLKRQLNSEKAKDFT